MSTSTGKAVGGGSLEVRVHLVSGSTSRFWQTDPAGVEKTLSRIQPVNFYTQQRIIIGGEHSASVFMPGHVLRVDFIRKPYIAWPFAPGFSDMVELPEERFRELTRLGNSEKAPGGEPEIPGDLFVRFVEFEMVNGSHIFLGLEGAVDIPAERFLKLQYVLTTPTLHIRMAAGGNALVNLSLVARMMAYPRPAAIPANGWAGFKEDLAG